MSSWELERLGWSIFFEEQVAGELSFRMARVVEEQRGQYRLAGDFEGWAEASGRFRNQASSAADYPTVGDWVCVAAEPGAERAVIHRRLNRRGAVSRNASGQTAVEQVLAANVDTIFLVSALTRDLNPRRIERYLTMVWEAGAVPVVVLNKADLCEDPSAAAEAIRERLPFVDVLAVSAVKPDEACGPGGPSGLDELTRYLRPAETVALLGSSGVGKSTLINRLLGRDLLKVAGIRDEDGKGRHTTTSRQLVELAGGALLIDTPGMRELVAWADESAVEAVFDDIAELARGCRFSDCAHAGEPGCAVVEAVSAGTLDEGRLEHYRQLLREAAFEKRKRDKSAAAEQKRKWKQMHQAQKELHRLRNR